MLAHEARLSAVLERMAQVLDFKLRVESERDPLVDIDASRRPDDLIMRIATLENVSMTQGSDPRCPHKFRILQVWILPAAREAASRRAAPTANELPLPETAEQAKLAQEGLNMVLKAHGMDPTPGASSE